ncbi:hypothetical protein MVEN_01126900 [Mycena venus]|uniref:Uncharacterized protein n=1 Tax=Mycena venus TaxID=2733690 RepID=A0A8H6Y9M8_9AGAR|nr:hypothetical protein MVEN_01126900 [Mycena venus]
MADVNMPQNLEELIRGSKVYNPPAMGWTSTLIRKNHKDEVINYINQRHNTCVAAVILSSDFLERDSGPAAIKAILQSANVPDADAIDIFAATPKEVSANTNSYPLGMPWTNIISRCTAEFMGAVLSSIFHGTFGNRVFSFYCIPVNPEAPFIVLTFVGIASLTPAEEICDALLASLTADPVVLGMLRNDHSNVPGDHEPDFVLKVLFGSAKVTVCTARRRVAHRSSIPVPAFCVILPPFSSSAEVNEDLRRHVMSADFSFEVPFRGTGTPWLGSFAQPRLMGCTECHGINHYREDCPIVLSLAYRQARGITEDDDNTPVIESSLSFTPVSPAAPINSTNTPLRGGGGGRGFTRGGRGWSRGRGRGGSGRGNFGHGYSPYHGYNA